MKDKKQLTVGEIRAAIADMPDDTPVRFEGRTGNLADVAGQKYSSMLGGYILTAKA